MLLGLLAALLLRPWDDLPALAAIRPVSLGLLATLAAALATGVRVRFLELPISRPLLLLWATMLATSATSYWPGASLMKAVVFAQQLLLFALVGSLVRARRTLYQLSTLTVACAVVISLRAVYAFQVGDVGLDNRIRGVGDGFLADPNELANTLAAVVPLAWWLGSHGASRLARLMGNASLLPLLAGIAATQSRGGLLSLGAGVAVMAVGARPRKSFPAAVFGLALLGGLAVAPSALLQRYATIGGAQLDESAGSRVAVWKAGGRMFADHFLTGVGMGCFADIYGQHYIDREGAGNIWRAAHNSLVEVSAELGAVGVASWLWMIGWALLLLYRSVLATMPRGSSNAASPRLGQWYVATLASFTAFLVGAMFLSRAYDLTLYVLVSLAAASAALARPGSPRSAL